MINTLLNQRSPRPAKTARKTPRVGLWQPFNETHWQPNTKKVSDRAGEVSTPLCDVTAGLFPELFGTHYDENVKQAKGVKGNLSHLLTGCRHIAGQKTLAMWHLHKMGAFLKARACACAWEREISEHLYLCKGLGVTASVWSITAH